MLKLFMKRGELFELTVVEVHILRLDKPNTKIGLSFFLIIVLSRTQVMGAMSLTLRFWGYTQNYIKLWLRVIEEKPNRDVITST